MFLIFESPLPSYRVIFRERTVRDLLFWLILGVGKVLLFSTQLAACRIILGMLSQRCDDLTTPPRKGRKTYDKRRGRFNEEEKKLPLVSLAPKDLCLISNPISTTGG